MNTAHRESKLRKRYTKLLEARDQIETRRENLKNQIASLQARLERPLEPVHPSVIEKEILMELELRRCHLGVRQRKRLAELKRALRLQDHSPLAFAS